MNPHCVDRIVTPTTRFAPGATQSLLLTGATGFLGGSVAAHLIADGHRSALLFLIRAESP
jgi:hypothetical protein